MFWALTDAAMRGAGRRVLSAGRRSPIAAVAVAAAAVGSVWFGPRALAGFAASQADFVALEPMPMVIPVLVLAAICGALTEPMTASMVWSQAQLQAAPVRRSTLMLSGVAPLLFLTMLVLGLATPALHAAVVVFGGAGSATVLLLVVLLAASVAGAAGVAILRAAWRRRLRTASSGAVFLAVAAIMVQLSGGGRGDSPIEVLSAELVGRPRAATFGYVALALTAVAAAWSTAAAAPPRRRRSRSMPIGRGACTSIAAASLLAGSRRRDVRSHLVVGMAGLVGGVWGTASVLELPIVIVLSLAPPIALLAALGLALAAGGLRRDAAWLFTVAPVSSRSQGHAVASAASISGVIAVIAFLMPISVAVGAAGLVWSSAVRVLYIGAIGACVGVTFAPWREREQSLPVSGVVLAGVAGLAGHLAVIRAVPEESILQIAAGFVLALLVGLCVPAARIDTLERS